MSARKRKKKKRVIDITKNFDWSVTNRELCIFMPNYHDVRFTKFSLQQLKTSIPKKDYVVIVGNDNSDDTFEEFEDEGNVFFFTIKRKDDEMRNGGFIRNYAIKRCQSRRFFQKDGEVVILGDFIKNCIEWDTAWRAGNIYVLDDNQTEKFMDAGDTASFIDKPTKIIDKEFPDKVEEVKKIITKAQGCVNLSSYHHYAYCVNTEVLQRIRGYDEAFEYYGYEDSDMFCRLYGMGHRLIPDHTCSAVHLSHPRNLIDTKLVARMSDIFNKRDPEEIVRNPEKWGEGV